jgi:hypothetical protein
MKNDRLIGSCRLSVVGWWRKDLTSSFLPTLATALLLFIAPPLSAQWEPDLRLTYDNNISYTYGNSNGWNIAANGDTIHVVWYDMRDGNDEIYYKRSLDGGTTWGSDIRLTNDSSNSWFPSIATTPGGRVHVVWQDDRNGNPEIYYLLSTDGGTTWRREVRLTRDSKASGAPVVGVSGSDVHVVWDDERYGEGEILYKRSTNGGLNWRRDIRLTYDSASSYNPTIAVTPTGEVHVLWEDTRTGNVAIFYKRSTDYGSTWAPETTLMNSTSPSLSPSVAASGSFVHMVCFGGIRDIYYRSSRDRGETWGTVFNISDNAYPSMAPSIGVNGTYVHVVWNDARDGNDEIYYRRSVNNGTNWEPTTRLTNNPFESRFSSVATSGSKVHVLWMDNRDENYEIYYKRNRTGSSGTETAEERGQRLEVRITAKPNPFTSFASVPGQEKETFDLYDIAGRKAGTYRGDRIGANLPAGVYFLRTSGKTSTPVRIVKVR